MESVLQTLRSIISTGRTSWGLFLHTLPLVRLVPLFLQEWMFPQTKALKTPRGHHNSTHTLPPPTAQSRMQGKGHSIPSMPTASHTHSPDSSVWSQN